MLSWLAANTATVIISAALLVIVGLIVRGMVKGRIRTCGDCGSCGGCGTETSSGCASCQFSGRCQTKRKTT